MALRVFSEYSYVNRGLFSSSLKLNKNSISQITKACTKEDLKLRKKKFYSQATKVGVTFKWQNINNRFITPQCCKKKSMGL